MCYDIEISPVASAMSQHHAVWKGSRKRHKISYDNDKVKCF